MDLGFSFDVAQSASVASAQWATIDQSKYARPCVDDALIFASQEIAELTDVIMRHERSHFTREAEREGGNYEERLTHEFEDAFAMLATAADDAFGRVIDPAGLLPFIADGSMEVAGITTAIIRAGKHDDVQALIAIAQMWTASVRSGMPVMNADCREKLEQPEKTFKWAKVVGGIELAFLALEEARGYLPHDDNRPEDLVAAFFKRKKEKWL